jgi:hypothetical protein
MKTEINLIDDRTYNENWNKKNSKNHIEPSISIRACNLIKYCRKYS